MRCGGRQRAAGPAPGCTFSVRAGLSLGPAMNHPARLPRRRGTAAACLAGASRRDTAEPRSRPGLGRQPRHGGAVPACPAGRGGERSGGERGRPGGSGRGRGLCRGNGLWCPNSFSLCSSSSELFPLHPLFFFFFFSSSFSSFSPPPFPVYRGTRRLPGRKAQQRCCRGSAGAAGAGGGAPTLGPCRRSGRGEAAGLRPEVQKH